MISCLMLSVGGFIQPDVAKSSLTAKVSTFIRYRARVYSRGRPRP
jgi:hypothetical protein